MRNFLTLFYLRYLGLQALLTISSIVFYFLWSGIFPEDFKSGESRSFFYLIFLMIYFIIPLSWGAIYGKNLNEFIAYIDKYKLIVTFNGSAFDIPFLKKYFKDIALEQAHIDLRFLLKRLGFKGGLKKIEKQFGLSRDEEVMTFTGYDAVRLWNKYKNSGDNSALDLLLKYNTEDIVNLEFLMNKSYNLMQMKLLPL